MRPIFFMTLLLSAPAWSAIAYSHFAHPKGDYLIEYPADWKRSYGIQTFSLRPPGQADATVKVSLELYPYGKNSPQTPDLYIAELIEPVGRIKRLDSRQTIIIAGIKTERLAFTETVELKGKYGEKILGPLSEVYLVLPLKDCYYVLKLQGVGESFKKALPEFERIAQKLQVKAPQPSKRSFQ